jgi:Carbohydrate binding module (family 6)
VSGAPPGASARIRAHGWWNDSLARLEVDTSASTPAGVYPLTITARRGPLVRTATVQLTVGEPPSPFAGTRWAVPGRIEVEAFDLGGEGLAYHDQDPSNNGGQYRTEGVDIETTSDVDGAYNVGYTGRGEWLRYGIEVATSGLYNLSARVAVQGGGRNFHVEVDGKDVTGTLTVPDTGWWQNWRTITSPPFSLRAGPRTLRIVFDSDGGNLNWISLQPVATSAPFPGTPIALPGVVQAEDFDAGGEGVGYGEIGPENNGAQYRAEGVDVESSTDDGGGFDVGWTDPGEWLSYTVQIAEEREYTLKVRVASLAPGGTFHLTLDGKDVTGPVNLPGTDGWQSWKTLEIPGVALPAGRHVLRLVMDSSGYWGAVGNFNWISAE